MDITITINCDNSAFDRIDCGAELARILRSLSKDLDGSNTRRVEGMNGTKLRDINGNTCGKVEVTK